MPVKLTDLVDWEEYKKMSESEQDTVKEKRGCSKSGLDWESDEDNPEEQLESTQDQSDLVEMYESPEDGDNQPVKSYIMSIHKKAAELYNILDDIDDPEEWVVEKAKEANSLLNDIHGHISYAKTKVEELDMEPRERVRERGW